jgi:hypothetical protein
MSLGCPAPPFSNPPTASYFYSILSSMRILLSAAFPLYYQHIELFERSYLAEEVMTAEIQYMMTMSEIGEMHAHIVANEYVLEHACEKDDYLRLLQSVEDVFGRMGDQKAFGTMLVVTEMLAGRGFAGEDWEGIGSGVWFRVSKGEMGLHGTCWIVG